MTITPRSVQKWVQERVQNDPYNLHAKNPCGFHATLFVQRLSRSDLIDASTDPQGFVLAFCFVRTGSKRLFWRFSKFGDFPT